MAALRPYQIADIEKLSSKKAMACFNEQRTGKTPTALRVMDKNKCKKILIICPASAIFQWQDDSNIWLPNKNCLVVSGTAKQRTNIIKQWTDLLIISYDSLKTTSRSKGDIIEILKHNIDGVILDECHRIKNRKSATAKSIEKLIKVEYKLALSGTPAPNKPEEIYNTLHWLYPTHFPSYWKFIDTYFEKELVQLYKSNRSFVEIKGFKHNQDKVLQQQLSFISTQRKRKEVMPWLPEKDYQKIYLPPTKEQEKYIKELEQFFETGDITTQGILDRLIRIRQICLHPILLNLKGESPKLKYIIQYIKDYPEEPIIIFSKFTSFLKILSDSLKKENIEHYLFIGETSTKERNNIKKAFQNKEKNILLLNLDAGKEALTLDTAETIIFCDKFPPVASIEQAEDRFISTIEEKKDKPHKIIELIMKGTYEEHIYKLIQLRKNEIDIINDYKKLIKRR